MQNLDIDQGWITLHRKLQDWEWYTAPNHVFLFVHLLLKANHKSGKWRGYNYSRGDVLTSLSKLSEETGLSKQNIRTILKNLAKTGEVNTLPNTKLTHLSVCKYDIYQTNNTQPNTKLTRSQHGANTELTTNNNDNNKNNNRNNNTLEERKAAFKKSLSSVWKEKHSEVQQVAIKEFFEHWTEHGENDKKMRYEKEPSFCISKRITRWKKNDFNGNCFKSQADSNEDFMSRMIRSAK